MIGIRTQLANSGQSSHLMTRSLIFCAKIPFPYTVTVIGSQNENLDPLDGHESASYNALVPFEVI